METVGGERPGIGGREEVHVIMHAFGLLSVQAYIGIDGYYYQHLVITATDDAII